MHQFSAAEDGWRPEPQSQGRTDQREAIVSSASSTVYLPRGSYVLCRIRTVQYVMLCAATQCN